jgi:flagellar basal body-associated protein FliL
MNYFHRTKDISLSKLETLADFFGMPLDYFRKNSKFKTNNVAGNNNFVGNVSISTNLMLENQSLRKELESKDAIIRAKDETIEALRHMNKMLQAQANNSIKKDGE